MLIFSHTKYIFVLLLFVAFINTEKVDDENQADDNGTASLESDSNEAYNVSSKEKPHRLKYQDIKIKDNILSFHSVGSPHDCIFFMSDRAEVFNTLTLLENVVINVSTCTDYMKTSMKYFPFAVSIQKKGSHYASGALIDKRWILTAAGPFYNTRESIKLLKVRLGSVNCKKGGTVVPLKEIVIHPSYINMEPSYDLALLRIGQSIKFSEFILPIPLATMKGKILSAKFQSTYWSRLIINHKLLPSTAKERIQHNSLRVSTQDMLPQEKCVDLLQKYNYTFSRSILCLEPIVSHHSPCTPDVGAPITANDRLWGITSGWTAKDCSQKISPTVFNRVSFPLTGKWIESTLNIF